MISQAWKSRWACPVEVVLASLEDRHAAGRGFASTDQWIVPPTSSTQAARTPARAALHFQYSAVLYLFWGIHLTEVVRRRCSPGAVRWRPRQARRMPTHPRRRWRDSPKSIAGDESW